MAEFIPPVHRIDKKFGKNGQLTEVKYWYKISTPQELLLRRVIDAWGTKPPITSIHNRVLDGSESLPLLRRFVRTKEYSDEHRELLGLVRSWWVRYNKQKNN